MRFKNAASIHTALDSMRLANYYCARNRAKVNDLFNGNPPWTEEERNTNKIFTNVNPLYGTRIAHNARQNLDNAILKPGNFFKVSLDYGPQHRRSEWGGIITTEINRILKREQKYADLWVQNNAQTVLHGIAPSWFYGKYNPIPQAVGVEDVLVPSQTLLDFSNLEFFGIYRQWTYSELYDMTHRPQVDPGWNMALVNQLLASLEQQSLQSTVMGQRWLMPEKLAEDLKENAGWYMTSAAPTIFIWDFYFRNYNEDDDNENWERRIVLDYMQMQPEAARAAISDSAKADFLYEQKGDYAQALSEVIHWQVGNCSNVAPFRYYSVRSLGFLLFAVLQLQNRLYCRFMDSTFESLLQYFRNVGEDDRERLEKVDLWHMGIVPDGLSFVTRDERHEINEQQVEMAMAMNQQLMQQSSSSWMPEIDTGTDREQTAREATIRLQTSASLSNALLNQTYNRATMLYREQCRRFCLDSKNKLVQEFRKRVLSQGVPAEMLDVNHWDVEPERTLGGGNKALEQMAADKLMAIRPVLNPEAQQEVTHIYIEANTDDPKLANRLVPLNGQRMSDSTVLATMAMGSLMNALPVAQKPEINQIDYVQTLLQLIGQVVQQIQGLEQVPNSLQIRMPKIAGAQNAIEHTGEHLQLIAPDASQKEFVRQMEEQLVRLDSALKGFSQHADEELQASAQQGNPEAMKLQQELQMQQAKHEQAMQQSEQQFQQKQQHQDEQWAAEDRRRTAETAAEIKRKQLLTQADIDAQDAKTAAEIKRPKTQPGNIDNAS